VDHGRGYTGTYRRKADTAKPRPKVARAMFLSRPFEAPEPIEGISFHVPQLGADMFYCEVTPADVTTATTTAIGWWLGMEPPKDASGFRVLPIEGAPSVRAGA
jgi:hypothetical protein